MIWAHRIIQRYRVSGDPLRTLRRIELIALSMGMLLCLQLVYGGARLAAMTGPESVQPAADSLQVPAVRVPVEVAAGDRNEIITRPLFWAGRRPAEAVSTLEVPGAEQGGRGKLDSVKLVGVFGASEMAGVIVLVENEKRRILLGEELDGWILDTVEPGESVFVAGARRETITLRRSAQGASPVTDSAPTAPRAKQSRRQAEAPSSPPGPMSQQGVGVGAGKGKGKAKGKAKARGNDNGEAKSGKDGAPTGLGFGPG